MPRSPSAGPRTPPDSTTPRCASTSTAGPRASWAARHRSNATWSPRASWGSRHHERLRMNYDLPDELQVEADGPIRIVRLNRPEQLNATNHPLHQGLADLFPQLDADPDARVAVITGNGRAFSAGGDYTYLDELARDERKRHDTLAD